MASGLRLAGNMRVSDRESHALRGKCVLLLRVDIGANNAVDAEFPQHAGHPSEQPFGRRPGCRFIGEVIDQVLGPEMGHRVSQEA